MGRCETISHHPFNTISHAPQAPLLQIFRSDFLDALSNILDILASSEYFIWGGDRPYTFLKAPVHHLRLVCLSHQTQTCYAPKRIFGVTHVTDITIHSQGLTWPPHNLYALSSCHIGFCSPLGVVCPHG
jgi:hypothetical protein